MLGHLQKHYDNSLDNLGNGNSFIWYGPRWAQAATAPSRLYKAYTTEGGVRVPFLGRWPKAQASKNGDDRREGVTDHFATVMDLAPTILAMAGVDHPAPTYKGRAIVPVRGVNMMPFVSGLSPRIHKEDFIQGWETAGRAALRHGNFKIVFIPKPKGPEKWQLYDLSADLGEIHDLSELPQYKTKMDQMLKMWEQYVLETGIVPLSPDLGRFLEATEAQMQENVWIEYPYYLEGARDHPERFFRELPKVTPSR